MTNQNYVDNLPIGEVVMSGNVLNAMYRRGIIPEYDSYFKYVTGEHFYGDVEYLGHFFELKFFSGCFMPYLVKTMPPMKIDNNGKRVPAKRIYYRCFKANFKRKTFGDKLASACWDLHYKVSSEQWNERLWKYVSKKFDLGREQFRQFNGIADHKMCLWGHIV